MEEQQTENLLDLTETEKIERLTNMVKTIFQISDDLKNISKKNIYEIHQQLLLEVGTSLMASIQSRINKINRIEKENRNIIDSTQWEQDKEIQELVEALRE